MATVKLIAPPPLEIMRELVHYDPETGLFKWAKSRRRCKFGAAAGCFCKDGRWRITIDKQDYLAHRIAWFWMTGEWPAQIDHRARIRWQGKMVRSGMFDTPHEAHAAYSAWATEFHGEFARAK